VIKQRFWLFILALSTGLFLACVAWAGEEDLVLQANQFYEERQYPKAVELYKKWLGNNHRNGHVYYNLANSHIRSGQLGQGILNYLKAHRMLPRDEDVVANLNYALRQTVDKQDWKSVRGWQTWFFWVQEFTLQELLNVTVVTHLVFWGVLFWGIYGKSRTQRLVRNLVFGLLITVLASTVLRWSLETHWAYGVILAEKVEVSSSAGKDPTVLFHLHEGTVVTVLETQGNRCQIALANGQNGWIHKAAIGT